MKRVAPALVRRRELAASSRATKVAARRKATSSRRIRDTERETARWTFDGVDMRAEFQRFCRLAVFSPVARELASLQFVAHRGTAEHSTGHHKLYRGKIHVTFGTGPWYLGSATLLHEVCHAAHDLLGLTVKRRRRYRLPSGTTGVALRHQCHDAEFHDLLRIAARQAFDLEPTRLMELHAAAGGSRKAYSMDAALRAALAERFG